MTKPLLMPSPCAKSPQPAGSSPISLLCLVVSMIWALANCVQAQSIQCDASLLAASDGPFGYQLRGDRCEGLYTKEISTAALTIVSFIQDSSNFDPKSPQAVGLFWDKPASGGTVRLRAQGLKHRLYYRMDSERPAGDLSYAWPSNVLSALIQSPKDIGIIASCHFAVAGKEKEVLLPLRVGSQGNSGPTTGYRLSVMPGVTLQELFLSLYRLNTEGQIEHTLKKDAALQFGYYPANRAIDIPLTGLTEPGIYLMELSARFAGGIAATELWFYHAGPP